MAGVFCCGGYGSWLILMIMMYVMAEAPVKQVFLHLSPLLVNVVSTVSASVSLGAPLALSFYRL